MDALVVPARCNGPRASGNGGWTAGALAQRVPVGAGIESVVTVRLMLPPPLGVPMSVAEDAMGVRLEHDGVVVATASPGELRARSVGDWHPVTLETAQQAATGYPGFTSHPFPTCLACGPERGEGDGLRIFPGRLPDGRVAAPWHANAADVPTTWAALDCVGGWSSDLENRPMVLGQMTAELLRLPQVGSTHVVVGTEVDVEGRKTHTRSELYDAEGDLVAHAEHVWIEVDPAIFNSLD